MYVVCDEHIEIAIDEFVEIYEMSPDIYLLDKVSFNDWAAPKCCDKCSSPPRYLVV